MEHSDMPAPDYTPYTMTETQLVLPPDLPYEEWVEIGERFNRVGKSLQWLIGDWLNFGENTYPDMYSQAIELTGYSKQSLQNMKWVASRIHPSHRRESVHWSLHAEVAALPPSEQTYWLECADVERWTKRQMRDAIHPDDLDHVFGTLECPNCGHRWEAA